MDVQQIGSDQASVAIIEELNRRIDERFGEHPFQSGINRHNFEAAIADYLAMSIAFPFIQAGAIHKAYEADLRDGGDASKNVEITGAIGAFLVWDEMGGHKLTVERGHEGLLHLTATRNNCHSHWLRKDIHTILGKDVRPYRSAATIRYLDQLLDGLSDPRRNRNVAYMIGFECHAEKMITALWDSVCSAFDLAQDERLVYFSGHVGGDAPAEAVHVEMTRKMVAELVSPDQRDEFIDLCLEGYALNFHWCEAIVAESHARGDKAAARMAAD